MTDYALNCPANLNGFSQATILCTFRPKHRFCHLLSFDSENILLEATPVASTSAPSFQGPQVHVAPLLATCSSHGWPLVTKQRQRVREVCVVQQALLLA